MFTESICNIRYCFERSHFCLIDRWWITMVQLLIDAQIKLHNCIYHQLIGSIIFYTWWCCMDVQRNIVLNRILLIDINMENNKNKASRDSVRYNIFDHFVPSRKTASIRSYGENLCCKNSLCVSNCCYVEFCLFWTDHCVFLSLLQYQVQTEQVCFPSYRHKTLPH